MLQAIEANLVSSNQSVSCELSISQYSEVHHLYILAEFWGCPHGVMVKTMDYGIVVSEFVLQSRYYVHFWANTLGKGMNPLILPAMG